MDSHRPSRRICDVSAALARMNGNVSLVHQLARFCREDIPPLLDQLREAVNQAHAADVHRLSHSVKGLLVNFDADASAEAARRLEVMGRDNQLEAAPGALAELERQTSLLLQTLASELSQPRFLEP